MKEQEIIEILKKENEEFRKISDEHRSLDLLLSEINSKKYFTYDEEVEKKKLQKQKLSKKDRMAEIIRQYKKNHSLN